MLATFKGATNAESTVRVRPMARKVVDSTFRKILRHTTEILIAIILLVIICIPIAFALPMWIQHILLGLPKSDLAINPIAWIGSGGVFWITIFLGGASIILGYLYISRLLPKAETPEAPSETEEPTEEEEIEDIDDDISDTEESSD